MMIEVTPPWAATETAAATTEMNEENSILTNWVRRGERSEGQCCTLLSGFAFYMVEWRSDGQLEEHDT